MSFTVAVDIGGTCTDTVVVDEAGNLTVAKAFSTPPDFSRGIMDSLQVAAETLAISVPQLLSQTRLFLHSTTVAENAIVDGALSKAGLLVTRGFESILYMTRGGYGRWSGLSEDEKKDIIETDKPPSLIPLPMIGGIHERVDSMGDILVQADTADIERELAVLTGKGVDSVGVCFLFAFRNGANEQLVRQVAQRVAPGLFLTLSSELAPVEGEYERTSTVALNAVLGPVVARYLEALTERLQAHGFGGALLIMQAHGGLVSAAEAAARAVGMIESGPIGGLVGSRALGDRLGIKNILSADMGGTTFKVGVCREGRIDYEREPRVYRYHYCLRKMDMVSIGIAGGSIISIEEATGLPRVGPRSAGSNPGPVCYGFGGEEPTMTDVDLLLGYLDSRFYLGGRAQLHPDRALRAFKAKVADPLGLEPIEAARSVYRLANNMLYDLLHKQTIEKGLDPRQYALFASGGTANMHMSAIAPELGVQKIVIPHSASVHGAFGLISSDVVYSDVVVQTLRIPADPDRINGIFAKLETRVRERLSLAGFDPESASIERMVNMRYRHQVHVISTPIDADGDLSAIDLERLGRRFDALYAERYGKDAGHRDAGTEMVEFHIRGIARLHKPAVREQPLAREDCSAALVETRDAYFDKLRRTPCYAFDRLRPGNRLIGPAIIWTPITTIVVQPGQAAAMDPHKNILITW